MSKKTDVITFRTTEEVTKMIDAIATEKEWSRSKVVEKICIEYFENWKEKK